LRLRRLAASRRVKGERSELVTTPSGEVGAGIVLAKARLTP
jgi:hypothetical protein